MQAWVVLATFEPVPALLQRQVQSIREQTISDWKCLVLDDGSADRSVVSDALEGDPRFTLLPRLPHLGPYMAFQRLLEAASGRAPVFLCDQDDAWHPQKMERMLCAGGTVFSRMRVTDPAGNVLRDSFLPRPPSIRSLSPARLLMMNAVSGAALMVSQRTRELALPFPAPQMRGWHDQWLAAVAARSDSLTYLDETLVDYTQHSGQAVGDGLRRITPARARSYGQRLLTVGLRSELRSRVSWIVAAARRLLELPGPDDPALEAVARGRFRDELLAGLRGGDVPLPRAGLLAAGNLVTSHR